MVALHCTLVCNAKEDATSAKITQILGLQPYDDCGRWTHTIIKMDLNAAPEVIESYLDILEGRYEMLASVGMPRDRIHILLEYGYSEPFLVRYSAQLLARLGREGIVLAFTAWESYDNDDESPIQPPPT